jgi:ABC-type transport system involved in cytochrome c biogenesis permease subunit
MNEHTLDELDRTMRRAVERWRAESLPQEAVDAALARLTVGRPSGGRRWRRAPAGLAAGLLLFLLVRVPAAWAEVAEAVQQSSARDAAPEGGGRLGQVLRPVLIAHVVCLLAAFLPFVASWGLLQVDLLMRLFGRRALVGRAARWAPHGAAAGTLLWLAGVILGGVWAQAALGRFWGWDAPELLGLAVLLVGASWWLGAWRWRKIQTVLPALVAAAAFWLMVDVCCGSLSLVRGTGLWRSALVIGLASLLNGLLIAAAWWGTREAPQGV